ncbi:hypothetical protein AAC387_Pa03g2972 [Persea americana]
MTQIRGSGAVPIDWTLCPIDQTGFLSQLTKTVHYPIDQIVCRINRTENMSQLTAFWHWPIDRTALSACIVVIVSVARIPVIVSDGYVVDSVPSCADTPGDYYDGQAGEEILEDLQPAEEEQEWRADDVE